MKAPKPAPINKRRLEDFIYLYLQISPSVCENAFNSHYGHEGPYYYRQLLKELAKRKLLSSKGDTAERVEPLAECSLAMAS